MMTKSNVKLSFVSTLLSVLYTFVYIHVEIIVDGARNIQTKSIMYFCTLKKRKMLEKKNLGRRLSLKPVHIRLHIGR